MHCLARGSGGRGEGMVAGAQYHHQLSVVRQSSFILVNPPPPHPSFLPPTTHRPSPLHYLSTGLSREKLTSLKLSPFRLIKHQAKRDLLYLDLTFVQCLCQLPPDDMINCTWCISTTPITQWLISICSVQLITSLSSSSNLLGPCQKQTEMKDKLV